MYGKDAEIIFYQYHNCVLTIILGTNSPFDLEVAEMLGASDPWYRSVVTYTTSNLLRIKPSVKTD